MNRFILALMLLPPFLMGQRPDTSILGTTFNYVNKNVDELRKVLEDLQSVPDESHLKPLILALERHVEEARRTRVGPDDAVNREVGREIYGETLELLQGATTFYMHRYGQVLDSIPARELSYALECALLDPESPFAVRDYEWNLSKLKSPLYVMLPGGQLSQTSKVSLRKHPSYQIEFTDEARLIRMKENKDLIPILEVDRLIRFSVYSLMEFDFSFWAGKGPPVLGGLKFAAFFGDFSKDEAKVIFWQR